MLLNEIIDLENVHSTKTKIDPWAFPEKVAGGQKEIGSGVAAKAFASKKPGTVLKTSYHKNANDPYISYLKEVTKHQNNPFFPRIYNAKLLSEENGGRPNMITLVVEMEKLVSLQNEKMGDTAAHIFKRLGMDYHKYTRHNWNSAEFRSMLVQKTSNPQFAEAIEILGPYFQLFDSDLHKGNFMVRLTGSGPQLVITDPYAPSVVVYKNQTKPGPPKNFMQAFGGDDSSTDDATMDNPNINQETKRI